MNNSPFRLKQQLSKAAALKKAERDLRYAKSPARQKKKAQNQRLGQRSDSDLHHTKSGAVKRVSINNNRGNIGRGTKNE